MEKGEFVSFQASCPACAAPVEFTVANSVVAVCPSCGSAVGRGGGKLENLGKVADLVQTDSPLQVGLRGKFKGVPFEILGRSQIRHSAGGVWDEWYVAFRGGKRWGWLAEAQGRWYLTFEQPLPEGHEIPSLADLDIEDQISIPKVGVMKVVEVGEGTVVSGEGEIPWELTPGELVSFADLSGGGRKFGTLDESDGQLTFYVGGEVSLQELGIEGAASRDREERRVEAVQVNCPKCGGPLDLKAPDQTLRVACPYCASMLSCDQGNLKFLTALQKRKIEPFIPLGSTGVLDPALVNADWDEPQELTVIGFMQRKVTYEGIDYIWYEYLLYKPRLPFYWLIYNQGHWSFGQGVPAGDVSAGPTSARYHGSQYRIYDRSEPEVTYVLGEFYWEVSVGERVKASDYIAPPDMLSRETSQNPSAGPKGRDSKRDKKNREINYTVSRYVPVEEIEKAFNVKDLRRPTSIAPNQPYPYKDIYKYWFLACVAAFFLVLFVNATSAKKQVLALTKQIQPSQSKVVDSDSIPIDGGDNISIYVRSSQWVYISGSFVDDKGQKVPGSDFGVYSGKTVYLSALGTDKNKKYKLQFTSKWKTMTSASPSFSVIVKQDVPHFSHIFLLGVGIMVIPVGVMFHHFSFNTRRWQDSDFSPYSTE